MRAPANVSDPKTPQESIKVSEELFLNQKRLDAAAVLVKSLEKHHKKDRTRELLLNKLKAVTTVFYQESSQKTFEHGNSLYPEQIEEAQVKFLEVLTLEPGNLSVEIALARSEIRVGKCVEALKRLNEASSINPYNETILMLKLKALECLKNYTAAEALLIEKASLLPKKNVQLVASQASWRLAQGDLKSAEELLRQANEIDRGFPENMYTKLLLAKQKNQTGLVEAQKYVSVCKNLSQKVVTKYASTPNLCIKLKEVEEYVELESQKMDSADSQ